MILVTGGTGFVGAHLLYKLASAGVPVVAMKREKSSTKRIEKIFGYYTKNPKRLFSKITWVYADLQKPDSLKKILKDIDKIYHCAGLVSYKPEDRDRLYQVNLYGTKNLLKAAMEAGVEKFLYLSSIAATNKSYMHTTVTEEMIWHQEAKNSDYARSKFLAELAVMDAMVHGLKAVVVNPSNILGPGSWYAGTSLLFQAVWDGLKFYPEGINGFVDVRDVTETMNHLMDSSISGERFIVSAENLAYKDVLQWIAKSLGVELPRFRFNALESELVWLGIKVYSRLSGRMLPLDKGSLKILKCYYYYSNEKIKNATGIRFLSIQDSIQFTAKLFLNER